ncbi:MAG: tyrosine-type recombinase/integrase [Dehalococcoidia bacterium]|nr:tyrosine-type recombinase/integrase [Dehalococcoidia bacterium]
MEEDIRLFLNYLSKEKKCSKNTLDAYHNDLSQLSDYIISLSNEDVRGHAANGLSEEHLKKYMASLKAKSYTLSTIARKIAAARTFLKFMADRGKVNEDLAPKLAAPRVNKAVPEVLSIPEVQKLLAETAKSPAVDAKRDRAMLELLYASGMLASELMALNVENVKQNSIEVNGQRGKARLVPLDKCVADIVWEYVNAVRIKLLTRDKEKALFLNQRGERLTRQGFWQIVQGYADLAGLSSKVTPRTIRHSFAVHRLKGGADIQDIQEVLGHAHISTTKAYKQV